MSNLVVFLLLRQGASIAGHGRDIRPPHHPAGVEAEGVEPHVAEAGHDERGDAVGVVLGDPLGGGVGEEDGVDPAGPRLAGSVVAGDDDPVPSPSRSIRPWWVCRGRGWRAAVRYRRRSRRLRQSPVWRARPRPLPAWSRGGRRPCRACPTRRRSCPRWPWSVRCPRASRTNAAAT